jgi:hypothetical protein
MHDNTDIWLVMHFVYGQRDCLIGNACDFLGKIRWQNSTPSQRGLLSLQETTKKSSVTTDEYNYITEGHSVNSSVNRWNQRGT